MRVIGRQRRVALTVAESAVGSQRKFDRVAIVAKRKVQQCGDMLFRVAAKLMEQRVGLEIR